MSKNKNTLPTGRQVTNEKLADMMEVGFEHVLGRIDSMDKKIDGVESKLGKKIDNIDGRVGNIESCMATKAEMNRRFDGLEDRVLASHQKRIEKLEAEIKELREMVATQI